MSVIDKNKQQFIKQLKSLKKVISDYDEFCIIAEKIKWFSIDEKHNDWFIKYPEGICIDYFVFREDYLKKHLSHAYVRAILSTMAFYEEWDIDFWNINNSERRYCLTNGKELYKSYAIYKELRFTEIKWEHLVNEIKYYATKNGIDINQQQYYLKLIENTYVVDLGGCYSGDHNYIAIKDDYIIFVNCGIWD
jgi:hypothetical protein